MSRLASAAKQKPTSSEIAESSPNCPALTGLAPSVPDSNRSRSSLELHPDKTRLIEFGRFAARDRKARGEGKPETFTFLGFTHYCGQRHKSGTFTVWRITAMGACAFGFSICVCPSSIWYRAFGNTFASARFP